MPAGKRREGRGHAAAPRSVRTTPFSGGLEGRSPPNEFRIQRPVRWIRKPCAGKVSLRKTLAESEANKGFPVSAEKAAKRTFSTDQGGRGHAASPVFSGQTLMPRYGRFLVGAAVQHFLGHGDAQLGLGAARDEHGVRHVGDGGDFLAGFQLGDQIGQRPEPAGGCTRRCS